MHVQETEDIWVEASVFAITVHVLNELAVVRIFTHLHVSQSINGRLRTVV